MRWSLGLISSLFLVSGCGATTPWSWNGGDVDLFYQALALNEESFEALNTQAAQANIQQWLPAMMPFISGIRLSDAQQTAIQSQVSPLVNLTALNLTEEKAAQEQFQTQISHVFLSEAKLDATTLAPVVEALYQAPLVEVTAMLVVWNILTPGQQSLAYANAQHMNTLERVRPFHPMKSLLNLSMEKQELLALSVSQRDQLLREKDPYSTPLSPALNTLALVDFLSSQQATPEKLLSFHGAFVQNQKVLSDLMILHEVLNTKQRELFLEDLEFVPISSRIPLLDNTGLQ